MSQSEAQPILSRSLAGVLFVSALFTIALLVAGNKDYPNLHTILDTGMFLLTMVLSLVLWDMSRRITNPLPRHLAISFSIASLLNFIHVMVTVEWSGPLLPVAQAEGLLRPGTWPATTHVLPIGIGCSIWLMHRNGRRTSIFALGLAALSAGLLVFFNRLPRYSPPGLMGITRPTLLLSPLLWAAVGWMCWRLRTRDRLLPMLALMSAVLLLANATQLYSRAPHDTVAIAAHLWRNCGYLVLLLSLMQMAALDMQERIRVESELSQLNQNLEGRVLERTSELEKLNQSLQAEIEARKLAETKLQAQLGRLSLLHQITRAIGERQDLASILQVVIRSLEANLPVDFSCVCLYDPIVKVLKVTRVGVKSEPIAMELAMGEQATIPIDENGLSRCVRGQLVYEPDISLGKFPFPQRLARGGLRSLVIAPLLVESSVFGILVAARREAHSFSSGECEFLKQLSEHVALASHQSQLYGALERAYDDLRQTQQAVLQQERLRALGQMASGIAHDINNAISPVALYTQSLLERETNLSERARNYLETIKHAIDDVAATVARMREFYRQREPQLTLASLDLNRLMEQVIDLTRARWSDMPQQRGIVIRTETEFAANLPNVRAVESEVREAVINLVFNAVDAMPDGGVLTLRTKAIGSGSARHAQVEVADNGIGMTEDTRQRCLEPFFTTKGERGTGLGLAMVYGMVKRHSAELEIESEVGRGTIARLIFSVPDVSAAGAEQLTKAAVVPSRLRILVIDDDPLLLKSLRDALEDDGHVVVTANGGQAGIETFRKSQTSKEPFSIVITDLGMPYVDGRKVAESIKGISSSTPVILLTGWGQRLVEDEDVPSHVDCVLSKPPVLRQLREALARCSHKSI